MTSEKPEPEPEPEAVKDGKVPPTRDLADASTSDEEDIAVPTPLEPGDGNAQTT